MAQDRCDKCEETGLLYDSGELPAVEKAAFEKELSVCPPCDKGYRRYAREKTSYFTEPVLSDSPSAAVDAKIMGIANARAIYTPLSLFNLFIKKSAVATFVLVCGLGLGFFAVYQYVGGAHETMAVRPVPQVPEAAQLRTTEPGSLAATDTKDSIKMDSSKIPFSKRMGNTDMQGVVPVDLNK